MFDATAIPLLRSDIRHCVGLESQPAVSPQLPLGAEAVRRLHVRTASDPSKTPHAESTTSAIQTIRIIRPNIVVTGSNLTRVEIWLEPTGTGVGPAPVGNAKRITVQGIHEKWIFPISSLPGYPDAIMASNAFAIAYDRSGREVGSKSLGLLGITQFNSALYGKVPQ